jgi:UDP-glucose-4-epimerase GalE
MSTILVTGGAGYVGSHACKALAAAGHTPVAYDNLSRGHREFARWGPLETGDIGDGAKLDEVIARHRVEAVMHFAALAYVGESVEQPALYYRNNVGGTLELLEAMRRAGVGLLVFSSTCATYGVPVRMPITEDAEQRPINPYGMTKLVIERVLRDYGAAYGLRSVALRYFNAAGCDPDGEIGENHDPETHLIPRVLMAADGTIPHVEVFGTDYPTPTAPPAGLHPRGRSRRRTRARARLPAARCCEHRDQPWHRARILGARSDRRGGARDRAENPGP